jgi:hypothetical protein
MATETPTPKTDNRAARARIDVMFIKAPLGELSF